MRNMGERRAAEVAAAQPHAEAVRFRQAPGLLSQVVRWLVKPRRARSDHFYAGICCRPAVNSMLRYSHRLPGILGADG